MAEDRDAKVRLDVEAEGEPEVFEKVAEEAKGLDEVLGDLDGAAPFEGGIPGVEDYEAAIQRAIDRIDALDRDLDELDDNLGIPNLAQSAKDAEREMQGLQQSIERGFSGAEQRLARVRLALNAYQEDLRRSAEIGEEVTESQIQGLRRLEQQYQHATREVGQFKAAQQQVSEDLDKTTQAAGGAAQALTGLDDVAVALGGSFAKFAGPVAAVIATFLAFYKGTQQVVEKLKEMGVDVENLSGKLIPLVGILRKVGELSINAFVGAADESRLLANMMNVLEAAGHDVASMTKEELVQAYEEFTGKLRENREETTKATEEYKKWHESIGLTKAELDKQAAALVENIAKFRELNQGVGNAQAAEIFKGQIQAILDGYDQLGEKAKASIVNIASGWGIATSEAEKHKKKVQELREALIGEVRDFKKEAEELLKALPEALEGLDLRDVQWFDPEQFDLAKQKVEEWIAVFRLAGVKIPENLAQAASQVGVFVAAIDTATGVMHSVTPGADKVTDSFVAIGEAASDGVIPLGEHGDSIEDLMKKYGEAGTRWDEAAESAKKAGEGIAEGGEKAGEGAKGLDEQGEAAGAVAKGMGEAATATENLTTSQAGAQQELAATTEALGNVATKASDDFVTAMDQISESVKTTFEGLKGFSTPLVKEIDGIVEAAQTAATELQKLREEVT